MTKHAYKMLNICYNVFSYLNRLTTKWTSERCAISTGTRTQFWAQNICYVIIPGKRAL